MHKSSNNRCSHKRHFEGASSSPRSVPRMGTNVGGMQCVLQCAHQNRVNDTCLDTNSSRRKNGRHCRMFKHHARTGMSVLRASKAFTRMCRGLAKFLARMRRIILMRRAGGATETFDAVAHGTMSDNMQNRCQLVL